MGIDLAVARYLDTTGVISFDQNGINGNTFLGGFPAEPDEAVMLKSTAGVALTDQGSPYDEPGLQVMTRGAIHDRDASEALALAIYDELVGLHNVTLDPGGTAETYVVRVLAFQSYPADLGRDENERWEFSQNYSFHVHRPTKHRT